MEVCSGGVKVEEWTKKHEDKKILQEPFGLEGLDEETPGAPEYLRELAWKPSKLPGLCCSTWHWWENGQIRIQFPSSLPPLYFSGALYLAFVCFLSIRFAFYPYTAP